MLYALLITSDVQAATDAELAVWKQVLELELDMSVEPAYRHTQDAMSVFGCMVRVSKELDQRQK